MGLADQMRQARAEVREEWRALYADSGAGPEDAPENPLRFELRHAVRGRLRVVFPFLMHQNATLDRVARTVRERPGVRRVTSNRHCASLTIEYDADSAPEPSLLDGLQRLTLEDLAGPEPPSRAVPAKTVRPLRERPEAQRRPRILWTLGGTLFVGLSALGVILPGLPTAPFVLLAAYCYLRGSRRLYVWLLNHPVLGKFVEETDTGVRIAMKAKKITVILLWVSIAISCTFFLQALPVRLLMISIGIGVSFYLLREPKM